MIKINRIFILLAVLAVPYSALASKSGILVRHSDGRVKSSCVSYSEDSISSLELLRRAGLNPVSDKGFIVEIDGKKAKSAWDEGASQNYWSFWRLNGSSWQYSRGGASASTVSDAQADGWQIGGSDLKLPSIKFDEICKADVVVSNDSTDQVRQEEPEQTSIARKTLAPSVEPKNTSLETSLAPSVEKKSTETPVVVKGDSSNKKNYFIYILITCFVLGLIIPFLKRRYH